MNDERRSDLAVEVWSRLLRIVQQTTRTAEHHMADLPITPAQYLAIAVIDDHGPQRQVDLAGQLHTTQASISQMLGRLESNGLVARRSDGRANVIDLTDEGRRLLAAARPQHREHIADQFDDLDTAQLVELNELLARLAP